MINKKQKSVNIKKIEKQRNERLGLCNNNKNGNEMTIIEYINSANITVKFKDGYITKTKYKHFKNGQVRNPYDKIIFNVGYVGKGKYNSTNKQIYVVWTSMLKRCYNTKYISEHHTYKDCEVCEEWHNFQNFAHWFDKNYYTVSDEKMNLDKDILHKGNKRYSPENCVFVPYNINLLFIKHDKNRESYPIGVYYDKKYNKYASMCCNGYGKQIILGYSIDVKQAFYTYKHYKEQLIKQIADKYKQYIPQKLYDAMYIYKIEITD